MTRKKILVAAVAAAFTAGISMTATVMADKKGFRFKALDISANSADWDPAAPWKLPKGYSQRVVSAETDLNIYDGGRDDWPDMNTVNETGTDAGRYLYRTHELRLPASLPEGGTVSVIDLETGNTRILVQNADWTAVDGIRWTPWGSILFAEETEAGRLFEIELDSGDLTKAIAVHDRPAVGRLAHEGIDIDADGNLYMVDEHRGRSAGCDVVTPCGGGIYKFVPNRYGDLSAGELYVLNISSSNRRNNIGQGAWLGPIDAANARQSGTEFGGTSFQRPEDLEIIGNTLYVAVTEGPRDEYGKEYYEGRVIAINLESLKVSDFVKPGVNVPHEIGKPGDAGHQTGFDGVDNLAESADGQLIMIEDNVPSDIWFASTNKVNEFGTSKEVKLFASLSDPGAEGTGIYVNPKDPKTLYVNVQHSAADDGDATWAISKMHEKDDR